jgi:PAS domain S-box-containing protein
MPMPTSFDPCQLFLNSPRPAVVVACDGPRWTILAASDAYVALTGQTRADLIGSSLAAAWPDRVGAARVADALGQVCTFGVTVVTATVGNQLGVTPNGRASVSRTSPVRDAVGDLIALLHEVDAGRSTADTDGDDLRVALEAEYEARAAAEAATSRTVRLQHLTAAMASARTVQAVADVVVDDVMQDASVMTAVFVRRCAGTDEVELVRAREARPGLVTDERRFPLSTVTPATDVLHHGMPVFVESREGADGLLARFPTLRTRFLDAGTEALASVPFLVDGEPVAAMAFTFNSPQRFTPEDRAVLVTLAQQGAQALQRVALMDAESRARRQLQTVVETVTDGFVAFDADLRYTYVNGRAATMWGMTPAAMLGRTPVEIWPSLGAAEVPSVALFEHVLRDRVAQTAELYAASLHHWVEVRAYPAEDGGIVVFFTDLTERRRTQHATAFLADASRALASSAEYTTTLANLATLCVPRLGDWCAVDVLVDPAAQTWPPALERVAVVHQDPATIALGESLQARYPTDWSETTGLPDVLRTGRPLFVPDITPGMLDARARDADHRALLHALHFRSAMIVPLTARGRVLGALTLCMTESERCYTKDDLALATELAQRAGIVLDNARLLRDAAAANATKTEFLRTISHELRQPLNATVAFLQLWELGLRGPLTDEMRADLTRVQRNQQHLMTLIEDLLSFTRLEAGRLEVERTPVALHGVWETLEHMIRPQMTNKGLTFTIAPVDPQVLVLADHARTVQVVLNLLTNALRATPSGGTVHLGWSVAPTTVTVEVRDTGVGIPQDKLEAIFAPFTQLGRALNRPKEGAGLGLAISRGLAEAMGGTLTAESVVGEGSRFALHLPRAEAVDP